MNNFIIVDKRLVNFWKSDINGKHIGRIKYENQKNGKFKITLRGLARERIVKKQWFQNFIKNNYINTYILYI